MDSPINVSVTRAPSHSYECKLCLTLHSNEGNYLAHTQGKRHQQNLAKRAARDASEVAVAAPAHTKIQPRRTAKIGRPGSRVTKQYDPRSRQRSLLFQIDYPEIEHGGSPRYRFMSAYEQKVEAWDKRYQYIIFAAEPYEVIAFKVPNVDIDKAGREKFFTHWDPDLKTYTCHVTFRRSAAGAPGASTRAGTGAVPPPPSAFMGAFPPPPPVTLMSGLPPPPPPPR